MTPDSNGSTEEVLARYAEQFNKSLTLRHFGATISFPSQERVLVRIDKILPHHLGGLGTNAVNGGVLAALFDLAIGVTPALVDPTRRAATFQLSMTFEKPVFGESLTVEAKVDRPGMKILFSSAWIRDPSGEICARCQGLVRLSDLRWKTGESPAISF